MHLGLPDVVAMFFYAAILMGTAQLKAAKAGLKRGFHGRASTGKLGLGWWSIGISMLVASFSAEQILGMAGAAYAFGIAVATYEWTAAIAILIIGKYLLPLLHKNNLRSIQGFLHRRYGPLTQFVMGNCYLILIIFIRLPVILWLSATAVHCITGLSYFPSLLLIGLFAGNYALYVGLRADAFGNLIQIILTFICGIIVITYFLTHIESNGGLVQGLSILMQTLPEHFHLFLSPGDNGYIYAPGIGMLFGGMWVLHFSYWGVNQGIYKRTTEDKDIHTAQHTMLITAILKLFFPVLVVLPGIIALYMIPGLEQPDKAIPELMILLPPGILGFIFSAMMVAAVTSMANELSQLSGLIANDILNNDFLRVTHRQQLITARVITKIVLVMIILLTGFVMEDVKLAYMYLQNMMGIVAPIMLTLFCMGFLWKGANQSGAMCAAAGSLLYSLLVLFFLPQMPFINRTGYAFLIAIALMITGSRLFPSHAGCPDCTFTGIDFRTSSFFNLTGIAIVLFLICSYALLW